VIIDQKTVLTVAHVVYDWKTKAQAANTLVYVQTKNGL